ncbi:MAG: hypothetical protein H8D22_09550 [Candidatus Cloacimonetes bacterium]|nr:hypothetical protein [Candidatus Cloacimonadota bacterium]
MRYIIGKYAINHKRVDPDKAFSDGYSIATFKHLVNGELIPKLFVIPDLQKNIYYSTKNYELIGFKEIEAYRYNPLQDAMYMELDL